eukprot:gene14225-5243_t
MQLATVFAAQSPVCLHGVLGGPVKVAVTMDGRQDHWQLLETPAVEEQPVQRADPKQGHVCLPSE